MATGDSSTSICNIGLIELGEDPIVALTDNRKAAILCAARYDQVRRALLREHPWNFAVRQAQLAASTTAPLFTYGQAYDLPADWLRMFNMPEDVPVDWEIQGRHLCTDIGAPLSMVYIADIADPTLFDPLFTEALGYAMAEALAMPLRQDKTLKAEMRRMVEDKKAMARLVDAQENNPREWDEDVWLRSRA